MYPCLAYHEDPTTDPIAALHSLLSSDNVASFHPQKPALLSFNAEVSIATGLKE